VSTYLVYVRQSYHRSGDADVSPEQQEAAARAIIPDGSAVEVIRDIGGHRSGRTDRRPGFQALMRRIAEPDVAGLAVYDLSRIGRSGRLVLNLHHELERRNLELLVANMPHGFRGATGRYTLGTLALAAQLQADLDSERMAGLTRTKHDNGGHNGLDPFGYRTMRDEQGRVAQPHRLALVPDEAELIREIFDRYGAGQAASRGALAAALNAEGKRRRGKPWNEQSVRDVLRRAPFYLGSAVYHGGADVRPGAHDPIITPEQRDAAYRAARQRHRPGRPDVQKRVYPLQGVAYCVCGLRMRAETQTRAGRSSEWRYYRCPGRRDGSCSSSNARAAAVEQAVIEHLAAHRAPPELVELERAELRRLRHLPAEGLSAQRERIEAAMRRVGERYTWGDIERPEYRAEMDRLKAQLAELPSPVDANVIAFDKAAATLLPFADVILGTTPEHQRAIIRHIVERVVIEAGEVRDIEPRLEARPFFAAMRSGMAVAPPEGFEPPTPALGRRRSIH
jgi:DNA invertase Pin-like site-specific DNA recombinase